jgi:sirohydrochlorin cobaltochelatase
MTLPAQPALSSQPAQPAQPAQPPAPLLLVGHGTRDDAGVETYLEFVGRMQTRLAPRDVTVAGGFIELSAPPLKDAVRDLVEAGHRHLAAVPLVLVSAGHGKGDIPGAMQREQARHHGLGYRYGRPLGPHPRLLETVAERVDAALGEDAREGTAVVLVGRGSSDPDANAEVHKVARLLWEGRGYEFVEPSFVSLAWPSVPQALDRARRLGASRVVVAPYFLFPGVLPERLTRQAREYARAHEGLDVRVAGVIGDCDALADVVAERYEEALAGDIRMNCDTCVYRIEMPGHEHRVGEPQRPHHHPDDPAHHHAHGSSHGHAHAH